MLLKNNKNKNNQFQWLINQNAKKIIHSIKHFN